LTTVFVIISSFLVFLSLQPPCPTLFPYTTLFRSPLRRPHHFKPALRRRLERSTHDARSGRNSPRGGVLRLLVPRAPRDQGRPAGDRKSTRLNSSHGSISYAVFCLKKKTYR